MATAMTKRGKKRKRRSGRKGKATAAVIPLPAIEDTSSEKFTFFFRSASPFSQWHPAEFTVDGVDFTCAEQYMMYQKAVLFNDHDVAQQVLATANPRQHKALGRKVQNFNDEVWKRNREKIVKKGNLAKFSQNKDLLESLKATDGTTLVEASPFDRVWGIGMGASNPKASKRSCWRGTNLLGEILTSVREELMKSDSEGVVSDSREKTKPTTTTTTIEDKDHGVGVSKESGAAVNPLPTIEESSSEKFTFFFRSASPFSQWHPADFTVDGVDFTCAEQYMMYQKAVLFNDHDVAQQVLATTNPRQHKALGRKVQNFDDEVWKRNREKIVKKGNLAKFSQNKDLLESLKATDGTTLVEASPFDRVWGIGMGASNPKASKRSCWRGTNLLGEILTSVREELMKPDSGGVVSDSGEKTTPTTTTTTSVPTEDKNHGVGVSNESEDVTASHDESTNKPSNNGDKVGVVSDPSENCDMEVGVVSLLDNSSILM